MNKVTTVKVFDSTKKALKQLAEKGETYDDTVNSLLKRPEPIKELQGIKDREYRKVTVKEDMFKCPKCGRETLGISGGMLGYYLTQYAETKTPYARNELEVAIKNLKKSGFIPKTIKPEMALKEAIKPDHGLFKQYENISVMYCGCGYKNHSKAWKIVKKRPLDAIICPDCNMKVEDALDNQVPADDNTKILLCPRCRNLLHPLCDILNVLGYNKGGMASTFDHVRIYPTKNYITSDPYNCMAEDLRKLLQAADILGYNVTLSGFSQYNERTFTIRLEKM